MSLWRKKTEMPDPADALAGRSEQMPVPDRHAVLGTPMQPTDAEPFPAGHQKILVGMGCFWGAERMFYEAPGVYTTAVGYSGGFTPNPSYDEVCRGMTGHNEVVLAVFDPNVTSYDEMLTLFWEGHDPTQGMRQGNDVGTQYRSGIYTFDSTQAAAAEASKQRFAAVLRGAGFGEITTEICDAGPFYYAEHYHQQYLHKVPGGYCGLGGTGLTCPTGVAVTAE